MLIIEIQSSRFVRRRSNFHGLVLKGLVETWLTTMIVDDNYQKSSPYFPQNKTYLVNGFTSGLIHDIWQILEHRLNFTSLLYKPENIVWGNVEKLSNGNYSITGIFDPIHKGRVDAVLLPYTNTLTRSQIVTFLPAVYFPTQRIVIPLTAVTESLDLTTFIRPFHILSWIVLFLTIVIVTLARLVFFERIQDLHLKSLKHLWDSFAVHFSGTSQNLGTSIYGYSLGQRPYNTLLITSLLSGYIIWTSYNASLTSELLVREKSLPFTDLESLSLTDWR